MSIARASSLRGRNTTKDGALDAVRFDLNSGVSICHLVNPGFLTCEMERTMVIMTTCSTAPDNTCEGDL